MSRSAPRRPPTSWRACAGRSGQRAGHGRDRGRPRARGPPTTTYGDLPPPAARRPRRRGQRGRPDLAGDAEVPGGAARDCPPPAYRPPADQHRVAASERATCSVYSGISYQGFDLRLRPYLVVGDEPSPRQQAEYERWAAINDAVVGGLMKRRRGGVRPRRPRPTSPGASAPGWTIFYLGHEARPRQRRRAPTSAPTSATPTTTARPPGRHRHRPRARGLGRGLQRRPLRERLRHHRGRLRDPTHHPLRARLAD